MSIRARTRAGISRGLLAGIADGSRKPDMAQAPAHLERFSFARFADRVDAAMRDAVAVTSAPTAAAQANDRPQPSLAGRIHGGLLAPAADQPRNLSPLARLRRFAAVCRVRAGMEPVRTPFAPGGPDPASALVAHAHRQRVVRVVRGVVFLVGQAALHGRAAHSRGRRERAADRGILHRDHRRQDDAPLRRDRAGEFRDHGSAGDRLRADPGRLGSRAQAQRRRTLFDVSRADRAAVPPVARAGAHRPQPAGTRAGAGGRTAGPAGRNRPADGKPDGLDRAGRRVRHGRDRFRGALAPDVHALAMALAGAGGGAARRPGLRLR